MKRIKFIALALVAFMVFGTLAGCVRTRTGKEVEINFNLNYLGAVNAPPDQKVVVGNKYGELPAPKRTGGYVFRGWYYNRNTTDGPVAADTKVEISENHALWAKWERTAQIKITYVAEDGVFMNIPTGVKEKNGEVYREAYVEGSYFTLPTVEWAGVALTITDEREFSHWETENEKGEQITVRDGMAITIARDHTVYARWKEKQFVWDFTTADDAELFRVNQSVWCNGRQEMAALSTYDPAVQALALININGDSEPEIPFDKVDLPIGTKVIYEISVQLPGGAMLGKMAFKFCGNGGSGDYGWGDCEVHEVNPVGGKWPTANGGIQTFEYTVSRPETVSGTSIFILVQAKKEWGWTNADKTPAEIEKEGGSGVNALYGAIYYVHKVSIVPPAAPEA